MIVFLICFLAVLQLLWWAGGVLYLLHSLYCVLYDKERTLTYEYLNFCKKRFYSLAQFHTGRRNRWGRRHGFYVKNLHARVVASSMKIFLEARRREAHSREERGREAYSLIEQCMIKDVLAVLSDTLNTSYSTSRPTSVNATPRVHVHEVEEEDDVLFKKLMTELQEKLLLLPVPVAESNTTNTCLESGTFEGNSFL